MSSQFQQYSGNFNMSNRTKTPKNAIVGFCTDFSKVCLGYSHFCHLKYHVTRMIDYYRANYATSNIHSNQKMKMTLRADAKKLTCGVKSTNTIFQLQRVDIFLRGR